MYKLNQAELLRIGISIPTVKALANLSDTSAATTETSELMSAEVYSLTTKLRGLHHELSAKIAEVDLLIAGFRRVDVGKIQRQIDEIRQLIG